MLSTIKLSTLIAAAVTDDEFISAEGMSWPWAVKLLQQLLNYAVAAGLLPALPGGSASAAAIAISKTTSSSSSNRGSDSCLKIIARDIVNVASSLIDSAGLMPIDFGEGGRGVFTREPAAAEMTLHLLALRCCQIGRHQDGQQQQQGMLLSEQLGRRMRGDLLLLPYPEQGQLLQQLLPAEAVLEAHLYAEAEGDDEERYMDLLCSVCWNDTVLLLHMDSKNRQLRSPVLSAAALQLSAELLLRAAAHWQRQYVLLPEAQQVLLQADVATLSAVEADRAEQARRKQSATSTRWLVGSCQLLQQQMRQLWASGQWQQQLQLLQQGGGLVLLQGLTLAVHCGNLDWGLQRKDEVMQVAELLCIVDPELGEQS
jgi:hypothetical protein